MTVESLKKLLIESLNETYVTDNHLYENELCERSKVFRIGLILSRITADNQECAGYFVDSEYNKRGSLKKLITGDYAQYPDLILHKRGNNPDENLLVVEFKVSSTPLEKEGFENDVKKIRYLTANNEYNYRLGAHVCLCSSGYIIKWYLSGLPEHGFTYYSNIRKTILEQPTETISNNDFMKKYGRIDSSQ